MKKIQLSLICLFFIATVFSQTDSNPIDSIERSLKYERGTINLKGGIGKIVLPKGFKYLNAEQSVHVIVDLWGNPPGENLSLGMILPENQGVLSEAGYVFNIQYDEIGYVKDDDADDIDYDELLTEMKNDFEEENKTRVKDGFDAIQMVGWASKPYYDADRKILHWAKELKFGKAEVNTLNYNIRILGRKGVLVLNAIGTIKDLPLVKRDIHKVLDIVQFNDGFQYDDFDSSIDEVAAWTIGGLVAGKVLAKVGFLAIIAKFGKLIFIGILGLFATFKNKIRNLFSKNKPQTEEIAEVTEDSNEEKENH